MSEWITDRLPTLEDAVHYCVLIWDEEHKQVLIWTFDSFGEGTPWQPIPKPAPYVKPTRWTVEYSALDKTWVIADEGCFLAASLYINESQEPLAQRICELFNEVMP